MTKKESTKKLIHAENLVKIYKTKDTEVLALQGLDLTINRGEFTAIVGNSGSGKSTLLHMMGMLDSFDSGNIYYSNKMINEKDKDLNEFRNKRIGFVFHQCEV